MANARKATKPTTRTTVTKSRKGGTTRTTTTRSTYVAGARRPTRIKRVPTRTVTNTYVTKVTKTSNWGAILAIIIVLLLLAAAAYLILNPSMVTYLSSYFLTTPAQQSGQFQSQFSAMNSDIPGLTAFYLANAHIYNISVGNSWTVQVTDQGTGGVTVGQLTISWNGQSKSFSLQNGIVNTGYSPTYAVTLSHSDFMSLSEDALTRDTAAASAYYAENILTGGLKYTRVN